MATQLRSNIECSDAEWQARQELAACYRIYDHLGWSESIYNHISLKVPGEDNAFLINPFGLLYCEVTASNLVKIDLDGNKLAHSDYPVNQAGFTQHAYFHRHLPWAHAISHVHTTETMAVCSLAEGLMPINFYACSFTGQVAYHEFEGVTVRAEEGERLLANLGDKRILMLRNHGPVVMARTLQQMFLTQWSLQRACEIQIATLSMGQPVVRVPDAVVQVHQRDLGQVNAGGAVGEADFAAWTRRIDRIDRSWRD
ncbi:ribulose-5-phosphate 4-epimerase/fuculose-1-phosphate aldolase [Novosphingobium hassiacum]|uniref:Ribulose-5-phosphate 4-epimerase/fuculose-1-phosphate aldolase n=1 Tax=Novosphingobium hassiacum TaxID=173676 RepID=A0A7W5ZVL2_9SPHN|nr:class II aldolase/adducin family protein [Novosphingobium hassiacum]MBB3860049.1 ribulose-5-phosphate 4-epimerase/fuculose-1-phosphate aldolase [Novosphingobium hassiacum]